MERRNRRELKEIKNNEQEKEDKRSNIRKTTMLSYQFELYDLLKSSVSFEH